MRSLYFILGALALAIPVIQNFPVIWNAFWKSGYPPQMVHPASFYWHMNTRGGETANAGFSFYTHIFSLFQEGKPLEVQMGMGGTWFTPTNMEWGRDDTCACNPHGWPSASRGDQSFGCCERPDRCSFLYETFEGGPGYWIGQLPTKTPKWRVNSAVGCYAAQTSTPLFNFGEMGPPHDCESMGIAQLSNRMLMAPDGLTFTDGENGMGMVGVGYVRTPLGKTHETDDRNFWTIVVDTDNFAGPIGYFIPEFWAMRWDSPNPSPGSAAMGDLGKAGHGLINGGGAFEWNTLQNYKSASGEYKVPRMKLPLNENGQTTLFKDSRGYEDGDIFDPLEAALSSGSLDSGRLMAGGRPISCDDSTSPATYRLDGGHDDQEHLVKVGNLVTSVDNQGTCHWSFAPDPAISRDGNLPQYFSSRGQPISESQAPPELVAQEFPAKAAQRPYDGLRYPPAGGCANNPGPASSDLICVRTTSPSWLAYRWYRFIDQPAIMRAGLSEQQKQFLQERVSKLHEMLARGGPNAGKWIKQRGSSEKMATVDEAQLVTPPRGMEIGYVPIVMYEGVERPPGCTGDDDSSTEEHFV